MAKMAAEARLHKLSSKKRLRTADLDVTDIARKPVIPDAAKKQNIAVPQHNSHELLSLFTDCMSALSTNKINNRNAFDVGIIDHMSDLLHLGDEEEDEGDVEPETINGIPTGLYPQGNMNKMNFTRASKVVEGASRIYGYRIEAVYDQTFNVLMNMNNASNQEGAGILPTGSKGRVRGNRKIEFSDGNKTIAAESDVTLAELPVDNVILDPYFLKISSMFDQSGATGLLLTNLQVSNDLALNLDGDNLVFQQHQQQTDENSIIFIDTEDIQAKACKGVKDYTKLQIIPEAAYFRNELQKLIDKKRNRDANQNSNITTDPTSSEIDANTAMQEEIIAQREEAAEAADAADELGIVLPMEDYGLYANSFNEMNTFSAPSPPTVSGSGESMDIDISGGGGITDTSYGITDKIFISSQKQMNPTAISFLQHLEAIDVQNGSQFTYFTNKCSDLAPKESGVKGNSRKTDRPSARQKEGFIRDLRGFMVNSITEELASIERLPEGVPIPKVILKKPYSISTANDSTGLLFQFNDKMLIRFGTLSNRTLRFSSDCDWRIKPAENNASHPFVQIYYSNDYEAPYVFKRLNENFVWDEEEMIDLSASMDYGYTDQSYGGVAGGGTGSFDDEMLNIPDVADEPMEMSIDNMYEADVDTSGFTNAAIQNATKLDIFVEQKPEQPGDIVPAAVQQYVDIFKIKRTLVSVVVPVPEFQDVCEDEGSLEKASAYDKPESITSFQNSITKTVNKLTDNDIAALNTHIMFVCLLHVCNEQNLLLRQPTALSDFQIVADAKKELHYGDWSKSLSSL